MKSSYLLLITILIFSLTILPQTVKSQEEKTQAGYYRPKLRSLWRRFKDTRVIKYMSSYWKYIYGSEKIKNHLSKEEELYNNLTEEEKVQKQ